MARKVVIMIPERRKSVWPKWKRTGVGVGATALLLFVNSFGFIPIGIFGFVITVVAATTFLALFDASYATMSAGHEDIVETDGDEENPHVLNSPDKV